MKVLNPKKNPSDFFDNLGKSETRGLLLDYDGTLAPFRKERDKAFPYPGVTQALEGILGNGNTRIVIISGRQLDGLIPLIGLKPLPELWGSHGGERLLTNGTYQGTPLPKAAATVLAVATDWMVGMGWSGKLERKPLSVALHWRGLRPEKIERIRTKALAYLPGLTRGTGLSLHEFDGGVEVRPEEITKARAVENIITEIDSEAVAYLGDDLTDEDAFAALKGRGLGVLVRNELRETMADVWLRPPEEVIDFLRRWKRATSHASSD